MGFQVIATDIDESVYTINSNYSILIYVAMPLSNYTMLNLKVLYNTIYKEGIKYTVSVYNIS